MVMVCVALASPLPLTNKLPATFWTGEREFQSFADNRSAMRPCILLVILVLTFRNVSCMAVTASSSSVVVVSTKKNGGHARRYHLDGGSVSAQQKPRGNHKFKSFRSRAISSLRSTFLPVGFPNTVPSGYLKYSAYSWIQDISTSLRAVLATQRVLMGIGVGSSAATALSATQNFLVRDAAGMAATLLFTATSAAYFSQDVKRWRLLADVVVDIGITLEVAAVQLPKQFFLPMLCLGNMCKAVCGVAAGACGGSLAVFWASAGTNISDINAKFGAQHTVTASLGLLFAAIFAKSVAAAKLSVVWALYSLLTALHIWANVQCMRLVAFLNFNTVRLDMVLQLFLDKWCQAEATGPLPTPNEISVTEPLFFLPRLRKPTIPICFGVSFNEFIERSGQSPIQFQSQLLESAPYLISTGLLGRSRRHKPCVVVACSDRCTAEQKTQAYVHASLLCRTVTKVQQQSNKQHAVISEVERRVAEDVARESFPVVWETFAGECRAAGWDLTQSELQGQGYEIELIKNQ